MFFVLFSSQKWFTHTYLSQIQLAQAFCFKNYLSTLVLLQKRFTRFFLSRKRFTHFVQKVFARWKLPSGKFRLFGPLPICRHKSYHWYAALKCALPLTEPFIRPKCAEEESHYIPLDFIIRTAPCVLKLRWCKIIFWHHPQRCSFIRVGDFKTKKERIPFPPLSHWYQQLCPLCLTIEIVPSQ